jgi:hypothetical protein
MNHIADIAIVAGVTIVAGGYLAHKLVRRLRGGEKACGQCGCGCDKSAGPAEKAFESKPAALTVRGREV